MQTGILSLIAQSQRPNIHCSARLSWLTRAGSWELTFYLLTRWQSAGGVVQCMLPGLSHYFAGAPMRTDWPLRLDSGKSGAGAKAPTHPLTYSSSTYRLPLKDCSPRRGSTAWRWLTSEPDHNPTLQANKREHQREPFEPLKLKKRSYSQPALFPNLTII